MLVSSDLAARGLDIPDITHIINLDFPAEPNEYIHRAGRTARGNNRGQCYSIVNPRELAALRIYQRDFGIQAAPVHLVKGKILPALPRIFIKIPTVKRNPQKNRQAAKTTNILPTKKIPVPKQQRPNNTTKPTDAAKPTQPKNEDNGNAKPTRPHKGQAAVVMEIT